MDIQKCIIVVTSCAVVGCAAKLSIDWIKSDNENKKNDEYVMSATEQIDSGISQSTSEDTQSVISGMSLMESITFDFFKQQGGVSETNEHTESSEAVSRSSSKKRKNEYSNTINSDYHYYSESRETTEPKSYTETQSTTLPTEQSHTELEPTEEEFSIAE